MEAVEIKVLGIAGVAKVGKDTFCADVLNLLSQQGIKCKRLAFADALKNDLQDFLLAKTGVNVYTDDPDSKELIRPLMVEYGKLMRDITKGKYWVDKVKSEVEENLKNNTTCVISDVRYPNEAQWINSINGGITVHLARNGILPANKEEVDQDPLTREKCTLSLSWSNLATDLIQTQSLKHFNAITQHLLKNRPRASNSSAEVPRKRKSAQGAHSSP